MECDYVAKRWEEDFGDGWLYKVFRFNKVVVGKFEIVWYRLYCL